MPAQTAVHQGCLVRGVTLTANGTPYRGEITFYPERAGIYRGVSYTKRHFTVTPDEVGSWEVRVPPSAVLGVYTVRFAGMTYTLDVPDKPAVQFADLAEVAK